MNLFFQKAFANLQKIGKALMLPVSVLPVAGILLGVGAAHFSFMPLIVSDIMEQAGGAIFGAMPILFAIGVALGFSRNDGVAALAAFLSYGIMTNTIGVIAQAYNLGDVDTGILGGIIAGGVGSWAFNRFYMLELPDYLGFFSGKRAVPIIAGFLSIFMGMFLSLIWPPIGNVIAAFSFWAAEQNPILAFGIYGFVERSLIPFGLHHVWNAPFFFEAGSCVNGAGEELNGVLTCYLSADEVSRVNGNGFGQLAGGYMFKMYGLPAAAIAMWQTAKPENKAKIGGIMISAALTSFLTGITEPIEFAFLFVAPVLYVIHAVFAGLAFVLTNSFEMVHGTSFSHGLFDFLILSSNSENLYLFPLFGLAYAVLYFTVFRWVIVKWDLKTPGREDNFEEKMSVHLDNDEQGVALIHAFGGNDNIVSTDACITRLRIEVQDPNKVDQQKLKQMGATGVIIAGSGVQAIFGTKSDVLRSTLDNALKNPQSYMQDEGRSTKHDVLQSIKDFCDKIGLDNIVYIDVIAGTRLRIELKEPVMFSDHDFVTLPIQAAIPVNKTTYHLLFEESPKPYLASIQEYVGVKGHMVSQS